MVVLLAGCGRDNVKVYHVVKDDSTPPDETITLEQNSTLQPQLQWTLPSGWQEKAPSQMRIASFAVTNADGQIADVGVIPLPAGENELDLVNMWRDQMQLPALTNETAAESVSVGNDSAKLFEVNSDAPLIDGKFRARILVAELTRGATVSRSEAKNLTSRLTNLTSIRIISRLDEFYESVFLLRDDSFIAHQFVKPRLPVLRHDGADESGRFPGF